MEVNCTHRVPAPCELCVFCAKNIKGTLSQISNLN